MSTSTLLLIDDDATLRKLLQELFAHHGFRVLTASDGQQGLRLARAHRPDLILSDIRMPGLDGHAAVAELRRTPGLEDTPVILMTGDADLPDMRKGMDAGADDYVPKPFDCIELLTLVEKHLARARGRAGAADQLAELRRNLGALLPASLIEPLHEIIGCASVLEVDAKLMPASDVEDMARAIHNSADTLNRRFENFVLFTRLEAGTPPPPPGPPVALDALVRHAAEPVVRRHHRTQNIRWQLERIVAPVVREYLAKIVAEVVDNACRYSISTEPIDIVLAATPEGGFRLAITDFGNGIPAATLDGLAHAAPATGGYGLRLAERLAETVGASWQLDNRPRRGVTVALTFPRAA